MELSFCELKAKEVINVCDGTSLGHISDLIIDVNCARVIAIVVPMQKTVWGFFKSNNDVVIPFNRIVKIGKDVILVQLNLSNCNNANIINILDTENNDGKQDINSNSVTDNVL